MVQGIYSSCSFLLGIFIPKFLLHELVELSLYFNHDMHLLLLEFHGGVKLLWVVGEGKTIFEINIVEPLLHVVLEEAEGRNEFSVLICSQLHSVSHWLRALPKLVVNVKLILQKADVNLVIFGVHLHRSDHL